MPKYEIDEKMSDRLENTFMHHEPNEDQIERYQILRLSAHDMAIWICENTPVSREQSLALTHLDEMVMNANAAIARNE